MKQYEQSLIQARTQRQEVWDSDRHAAARERQELKQKHATQRWGLQKTPHPGTGHHFITTRAAERDARQRFAF